MQAIRVTNAQLNTRIMQMINEDIIDLTPEDLTSMNWVQKFYVILRHTSAHLNLIRSRLPDTSATILLYHNRSFRVQRLMSFLHNRPPIKEHKKLLDNITNYLNTDPRTTYNQQVNDDIVQLKNFMEEYLMDLT